MAIHIVKKGECLSSIAQQHGLRDWRRIYDHPENSAFRNQRPDPNIIYPGDQVFLPDREEQHAEAATEARHRFRVNRARTYLRLRMLDEQREPAADRPYTLTIGEETIEGRTDGDGKLETEITADATEAQLTVEYSASVRHSWRLTLGALDPIDEVTGVQARLTNLGYYCPVDGVAGPRTERALRRFQQDQELTVTNEADEATRNKLVDVYGC